jgi:hypothetical protein
MQDKINRIKGYHIKEGKKDKAERMRGQRIDRQHVKRKQKNKI